MIGIAARLLVASAFPGEVTPDEIFQYVEPAHKLVFGTGVVTWEFVEGVRSWVLPGLFIPVLEFGKLLGESPRYYWTLIRLITAGLSMIPVYCGYRWGEQIGGLPAAVSAGVLNALAFEPVYFACHPLADTLSAPLLLLGLYLSSSSDLPMRSFTAGLLLGVCIIVRVQLAPAIAIGVLIQDHSLQPRLLTLSGMALALALGGILDWITWGHPFQSIWLYIWINLADGVANGMGTLPWYAYLGEELSNWSAFFPLFLGSILVGARRLPGLGATAGVIFVTFSAVAHKEFRFVYPALPILMTLAGIGSADVIMRILRYRARIPERVGALALGLFWTSCSAYLGTVGPFSLRWYQPFAQARAIINKDRGACGVAVSPPMWWTATGGYSSYAPNVHLYALEGTQIPDFRSRFNYILALPNDDWISHPPPPGSTSVNPDFSQSGFQKERCWTAAPSYPDYALLCLWRRSGSCSPSASDPPLRGTNSHLPDFLNSDIEAAAGR